ncbi:unnamed protein product [Caenorhabditis bovis]|uniref:Uncharacterized protein n=1 Tax=Caenorhabditis bovis TaxID=2654633 RepID=A0A8S1FAI7_9PELO|nr:unnamed protein product [Caenorhabditis bovis]
MNVPSTSNRGYAKYQIRSSGMPKVLANDTEVFSLEDCDEVNESKHNGGNANHEEEKSRLVECRLDSDEDEEEDEGKKMANDDDKKNIRQASNSSSNNQSKERCRLRDSFDLDNDSLSDDLDLLPPVPGAPNSNSSWFSKLHKFNCCNPRIPSKCLIM